MFFFYYEGVFWSVTIIEKSTKEKVKMAKRATQVVDLVDLVDCPRRPVVEYIDLSTPESWSPAEHGECRYQFRRGVEHALLWSRCSRCIALPAFHVIEALKLLEQSDYGRVLGGYMLESDDESGVLAESGVRVEEDAAVPMKRRRRV